MNPEKIGFRATPDSPRSHEKNSSYRLPGIQASFREMPLEVFRPTLDPLRSQEADSSWRLPGIQAI